MQHAQEAHKGDGNEGSPIPKQGHQGLDNRDRDNGPALAGLDSLPLVVDLPGRPKAGLELREPTPEAATLAKGSWASSASQSRKAAKHLRIRRPVVDVNPDSKSRGPRGVGGKRGGPGLRSTSPASRSRRRSHRPRGRENLEEATCTSKAKGEKPAGQRTKGALHEKVPAGGAIEKGGRPGCAQKGREGPQDRGPRPAHRAARLAAAPPFGCGAKGHTRIQQAELLESRGPHVQGA